MSNLKIEEAVLWKSVVAEKEGGRHLRGYLLVKGRRNYLGEEPWDERWMVMEQSGVTIATGFDLGRHSWADIKRLEIAESLRGENSKLKPFAKLPGAEAGKMLYEKKGLTITPEEALSIDLAKPVDVLKKLALYYEKARPGDGTPFYSLPIEIRTAIFSFAYQYGPNGQSYYGSHSSQFWKHVTAQNWTGAIAVLESYKEQHVERRRHEASLIRKGMNKPPQAPPLKRAD